MAFEKCQGERMERLLRKHETKLSSGGDKEGPMVALWMISFVHFSCSLLDAGWYIILRLHYSLHSAP